MVDLGDLRREREKLKQALRSYSNPYLDIVRGELLSGNRNLQNALENIEAFLREGGKMLVYETVIDGSKLQIVFLVDNNEGDVLALSTPSLPQLLNLCSLIEFIAYEYARIRKGEIDQSLNRLYVLNTVLSALTLKYRKLIHYLAKNAELTDYTEEELLFIACFLSKDEVLAKLEMFLLRELEEILGKEEFEEFIRELSGISDYA